MFSITTAGGDLRDTHYIDGTLTRVKGTPAETAIDLVTVTSDYIYFTRIGSGYDRKYNRLTKEVTIDYDRDSLANSKVNFSRYSELKPKINEGISYNDFISYIGGVEGTVIEKSSYSTKYVWVSSDGSYLNGTFSSSSGKCTFASGMIK